MVRIRAAVRYVMVAVLAGTVAVSCASGREPQPSEGVVGPSARPTPAAMQAPSVPETTSPAPTPHTPSIPPAASTPRPAGPVFHGTASAIDPATRARMTASWRAGCPVPLEDLRLLQLDHWGFDGAAHRGEMVVHRDVAKDAIEVFRRLFQARFPIQRMVLVDEYGGDDARSMAANNTSAFNCRAVTGGSSWSEHSYGWAIDINPVQNPYVTSSGTVLPPAGADYVDRATRAPGVIHHGDVVVDAFASIGWGWGGDWTSIKDYQHFSATGR